MRNKHTHIVRTSTVQFLGPGAKGRASKMLLQSCGSLDLLFLCTPVMAAIFDSPLLRSDVGE